MNERATVDEAADSPPAASVGDALRPPQNPSVAVEGIAVLGSHPVTVMQAPFDKPWKIYACSPHNYEKRQIPRFNEWFEIHKPLADRTRAYPYLRWLETIDQPVWMRDRDAMHLFKNAREYPEAEYKKPENFGPFHFTSSIAFIMAKAIKDIEAGMAGKQIGLFGIMQASENEFVYQRPGIQFMILEAVRRGIKVVAPPESKLFEPPPEDF